MAADLKILDEQIAYYRARATEYDEWFFRQGRYDRGPDQRAQWFREVAIVEAALAGTAPTGDVVELACGTGLWTERLARTANRVCAIDAVSEVIALNRQRVSANHVEYRVADIFGSLQLPPADFVFFAFWLSHVPAELFERFWNIVRGALRPRGRVFLIDSLREPLSKAVNHEVPGDGGVVRRKVNDGREFRIVKLFYEPAALQHRLSTLGWKADLRSSGTYFLYGSAELEG
jgi:demethylmenaquinone methyltransferase/2-methoxy-6-polyprenyl-1,4-benzoquinol methylase